MWRTYKRVLCPDCINNQEQNKLTIDVKRLLVCSYPFSYFYFIYYLVVIVTLAFIFDIKCYMGGIRHPGVEFVTTIQCGRTVNSPTTGANLCYNKND